jgi:hypothetical protein
VDPANFGRGMSLQYNQADAAGIQPASQWLRRRIPAMTTVDLLQNVRFVVDGQGQRKAALLDIAIWEEVLSILEDLEDAEEMRQARQEPDELIPWEQVQANYSAAHPDADL